MLAALFILLSNAVRETPQPVVNYDSAQLTIEALTKSIASINSIEYKQHVTITGVQNDESSIELHYYFEKPHYLRIENKSGNNISVDIYTPEGMYEYFPLSNMAYFRESWKDENQLTFQLNDKVQDIRISGKFQFLKMDRISGMDSEILRSVDEDNGSICEHKIWLIEKEGLKLPLKEQYLTDGEVNLTYEYEYISINDKISSSMFQLKPSEDLKIQNVEGIPKLVKDEKEAERFVKFNVVIPEYLSKGFSISEILVIPPAKTPSVLVEYLAGINAIYYNQRNIRKNELVTTEVDEVIKVGSRKFAIRKLSNDSVAVRWVKDNIEFEISGPYTLKDEIVKLVKSVSGVSVTIE